MHSSEVIILPLTWFANTVSPQDPGPPSPVFNQPQTENAFQKKKSVCPEDDAGFMIPEIAYIL